MNIAKKYGKSYFMPPVVTYDWVKKDTIDKSPIWCSVDRGGISGSFRDRVQLYACPDREKYDS